MASQELLFVFVVEIFNHKEPTNVIYESILVCWVIVDGVFVLAVITD